MKYSAPDLCYAWGEGVPSCDARLLDSALTGKRHHPVGDIWDPGFLEELEKRGYDLTTLKFSVQKKSVSKMFPNPKTPQKNKANAGI